MTPEENRRRVNRLRAEELPGSASLIGKAARTGAGERHFGPERRRQAQLNRQRMRATA